MKTAVLLLVASLALARGQPQVGAFDAKGTIGVERGGSCGYTPGYPGDGVYLTAFSTALYGEGAVCGACFVVACVGGPPCKAERVVVTATNECRATNATNPCVVPRAALALQGSAFDLISARRDPGIVDIKYRPVPCVRTGGIQFVINAGNMYYLQILIQNVAGPGALKEVFIKTEPVGVWTPMARAYGAVWEVRNLDIRGKPLSFLLKSYNDERVLARNAIPNPWKKETIYQSDANFGGVQGAPPPPPPAPAPISFLPGV